MVCAIVILIVCWTFVFVLVLSLCKAAARGGDDRDLD